ncbi:MAG: TonB-dependent receptor plug domain-containing protein, partial [Bacteroidota bacterium]
MKKTILTVAVMCLMGIGYGQENSSPRVNTTINNADTTDVESFDEVLVSSQRFAQKRKDSPRQIEVVSAKRLAELQPATLGDALINTGQVFVQKSQMGGSSPVLRGFEASRVLMVVDGVRMNNATYRAGHL